MQLETAFQNPQLCHSLLDRLNRALDGRSMRFMEVCGTHTVAIFQSGLRSLLPSSVTHLSGPGCPVCVTHDAEVAAFLDLAGRDRVILATFGELLRTAYQGLAIGQIKQGPPVHILPVAQTTRKAAVVNARRQRCLEQGGQRGGIAAQQRVASRCRGNAVTAEIHSSGKHGARQRWGQHVVLHGPAAIAVHLARQRFQSFNAGYKRRRIGPADRLAVRLCIQPHEGLKPNTRKGLLLQPRVLDNSSRKNPPRLTRRILPQQYGPQGVAAVTVHPAPHLTIGPANFAGNGPSAGGGPVYTVAP